MAEESIQHINRSGAWFKAFLVTFAALMTVVAVQPTLFSILGNGSLMERDEYFRAVAILFSLVGVPLLVVLFSAVTLFRAQPEHLLWKIPLKLSLGFLVILTLAVTLTLGAAHFFTEVSGD